MKADQNPKGRAFILYMDNVYVMSECCSADIDEARQISVVRKGEHVQEDWAMCSKCHRTLECNMTGWTAHPPVSQIESTRPGAWDRWGKFWFGLDDFAMEVN